jgi:hypothetical protein
MENREITIPGSVTESPDGRRFMIRPPIWHDVQ